VKTGLIRNMELSLLVILILACLGAVSSIGFKGRESVYPEAPARESQNRFLEYLNSPITP